MNNKELNLSYSSPRTNIIDLIKRDDLKILDVGCSNGSTGGEIKSKYKNCVIHGVEYDPNTGTIAEDKLDKVYIGSVEDSDLIDAIPDGIYDVLIFGDVLEHLRDPEETLILLKQKLVPKGQIIVSVPNMQHINAIYNLAVRGYWPNNERGIFDKTHLRIFTKKNLLEVLENSGFTNITITRTFRFMDKPGSKFPFRISKYPLTLLFPNLFTFQYLAEAKLK